VFFNLEEREKREKKEKNIVRALPCRGGYTRFTLTKRTTRCNGHCLRMWCLAILRRATLGSKGINASQHMLHWCILDFFFIFLRFVSSIFFLV
jgi:hypothetical protein